MIREMSMASKPTSDSSSQAPPQGGENAAAAPTRPSGPSIEHQISTSRNQVIKSGPLFLSSKGIGWTSWKKRWFVLTRTSLVFFRSDPNAANQRGGEMNLTLGGIDLNNSASVEVKADKKLITVFFPDGGDGRAFTLKAETSEDLYDWKNALESALALAPSATLSPARNCILEQPDETNGSPDQQSDKPFGKSMVIGRPILLALEDIDGTPSFLEKALKFIENHGVKTEGILRQAADVEEVYRRVREYEQGKTEFSPDEDAHVIADCVKYILRELPSSPVPASCCTALLEAYRDRSNRLNAIRNAILETFPEPNRKLLQRILVMMLSVASHKTVNRMSVSAVAACMSPLLLRPLLNGECQLENTHMDVAGDGSLQLLQAAAAANHAQAIIILLLEEYKNIFGQEGSVTPDIFSDSDECESGSDDDDMYEEDDDYEDDDDSDHEDGSEDYEGETDDESEHSGSETCSSSGDHRESDSGDDKRSSSSRSSTSSSSKSSGRAHKNQAKKRSPSPSPHTPAPKNDNVQQGTDSTVKQSKNDESSKAPRDIPAATTSTNEPPKMNPMAASKFLGSSQARRFGRSSAKKNVSMESIDFSVDDEDDVEKLEAEKAELQNQIAEEVKGNAKLLASLEQRKKSLYERRQALEKEVGRLKEQLQKEKDLRAALEAGRSVSNLPAAASLDEKTKAEVEEIASVEREYNNLKKRAEELEAQLNHEREINAALRQGLAAKTQESSGQKTSSKTHESSSQKTTSRSSNKESAGNISRHGERSSKSEGQQNYHLDGSDHNERKRESSRSGSSVPRASSSTTSRKHVKEDFTAVKGDKNDNSTFSKLTTRLNFLKERRNQIASELESMDKEKGHAKAQLEPLQIARSAAQGVEGSFSQHPEDSGSGAHHQSGHHAKDSHRRSTSLKPGTPPPKDLDPSKKATAHSQSLNRMKSE